MKLPLHSTKALPIIITVLLITCTVLTYGNILSHDFIDYDDGDYVTNNRHVQQGISFQNIIWAFTTIHASNWHPLTWLSHMLDCQFYGMNPGLHHLTNLLFHVINTLLLFFIFNQMTGKLWQSAFISALFALHPVHVESVAWVAERKDVLSTFFWMLTMWAYFRYVKHRGITRYVMVMLFFILGLLSKPMLVTLPFILILLDFWPLNRFQTTGVQTAKLDIRQIGLHLVWEKMPLFILSGISGCVTLFAQQQGGALKSLDFIPFQYRLANALVSYAAYMEKMIIPTKLAVLYPHPGIHPWWKVAISGALIVFITAISIKSIKNRPYFIMGWLWYLVTLLPVIGLIQVGIQSMADRYAYIPLIGLFIVISWGAEAIIEQWRYPKVWLTLSALPILLILTAVTLKQLTYWKNGVTLFEHTLAVTGNNATAHYALGISLFKAGRVDDAVEQYNKSLRISSNQPETFINLGLAYNEKGDLERALFNFQKAAQLKPDSYEANYNAGTAYLKKGDYENAIIHLQKAVLLKPESDEANFNLGNAYFKKNAFDDAMPYFKKSIEQNPTHIKAYQSIGMILYMQGRPEEAETYFKHALLNDTPESAISYNYLGAIFLKRHNIHDALINFKKAVELDPEYGDAKKNLEKLEQALTDSEKALTLSVEAHPENPDSYYQLGRIYQSQALYDKAIESYQQAISLKPDFIDALFNRGICRASMHNFEEAILSFKAILNYQPDNSMVCYNIACLYAKQNNSAEAIKWLGAAIEKGYSNWEQIKSDPDLQSIRNSDFYKQIQKKYRIN